MACAVAIAVDATVVRLVLVPALMAMFDEWNWWLPRWLDRILPSVDFEKPLPKVDIGDLVIIPDDISALARAERRSADGGEIRRQAQRPLRRKPLPSPIRSRSAAASRDKVLGSSRSKDDRRVTAPSQRAPQRQDACRGRTRPCTR